MKRILVLLVLTVMFSSTAAAQSVWDAGPALRKGIQLEMTRGLWDDPLDMIGGSTVHGFVTGSIPLDAKTRVMLEIPFSNGAFDVEYIDSKFLIGNPRVSLHHSIASVDFQVGFRLPTAADDGGLAAELPTIVENDRVWSFFPDVATFEAGATRDVALNERFSLRMQLMPQVALPKKCRNCDTELFVVHGLGVRSEFTHVAAGLGLSGIAWITEKNSGSSLLDRNYMLGGTLALKTRRVVPQLLVRLPLKKDVRDAASALVTLSFRMLLDR